MKPPVLSYATPEVRQTLIRRIVGFLHDRDHALCCIALGMLWFVPVLPSGGRIVTAVIAIALFMFSMGTRDDKPLT